MPEVVGDAGRLLALRVEAEQLAGELADPLAGTALEQLPGLAAELRERRRAAVHADVPGDLAELLVRDVEAVVAAECEQEVVARDARDLLRVEPEELADAVVLVDDVIACSKVGKGLERATDSVLGATRLPAEDLCVRQNRNPEVAPHEATAGGRDGVEQLGVVRQLVARLEHAGVDPSEEVLVAERLAAVGERNDDAEPGADERSELLLGLGEAAGRDRGSLGLERDGLAGRERIELCGALQRLRLEGPPRPDLANGVGLPDEVGRPAERRDQVGRGRGGCAVIGQRGLGQVCEPLRRRVDHRAFDGVQRSLREGRVGAHRLDLVAEELDAQRLSAGRGEDVDDPPADSELPTLLGALDALVAGERQLLRQVLLRRPREAGSARAAPQAAASLPRSPQQTPRRALPPRARRAPWPARRRGAAPDRGRSPSERRGSGGARRARRRGTSRPPRRRRVRRHPREGRRRGPAGGAGGERRGAAGSAGSETRARGPLRSAASTARP